MALLQGYKLSKEILDKRGKPPRIFTIQQFIIWKFLKFPSATDWVREGSIADKLVAIYPKVEFWNFVDLEFKLNSVAWFLGAEGKEFLRKEKRRMEFIQQEVQQTVSIKLEEKPIGENVIIPEKPKSLLDFLKPK